MWCILCTILMFFLSGTIAFAQKDLNIVMLKTDTQIFESIVHQILRQNFNHPFAIQGAPEGVYLRGYGVVFSFHLTINRHKIRTPWGEVPAPKAVAQRSREEQIGLVKDIMTQCLADHGDSIKQLGGHDRISIAAQVEDRNELDPLKKKTVIVLSAPIDDIGLFAMKKISIESFRERVAVLEY